jgi:ribosomal protein S27AE
MEEKIFSMGVTELNRDNMIKLSEFICPNCGGELLVHPQGLSCGSAKCRAPQEPDSETVFILTTHMRNFVQVRGLAKLDREKLKQELNAELNRVSEILDLTPVQRNKYIKHVIKVYALEEFFGSTKDGSDHN